MSKSESGKLGNLKSRATQQAQKQQRIKDYLENPNYCAQCGQPLPYEKRHNKFCNSSCSASYSNTRRERTKTKTKTFVCMNCGKINKISKCSVRKFCNTKCQMEYQQNQYIQKWKKGEVDGLSGYQLNGRIKKYMLEKAEYKCEICGWHEINPVTGKSPLEVHHIDGDYTNNIEENLQVLCPNCHSLTSTYKAINKCGRKQRRQYK